MGKLYNYLNVKEFNSPNKMTLLWGNTDNIFHFTDDFSFLGENISRLLTWLNIVVTHLTYLLKGLW